MPTATVTGALLGWGVKKYVNSFRHAPSWSDGCLLPMVIGAAVANMVLDLDNEAKRVKCPSCREREKQTQRGGADGGVSSPMEMRIKSKELCDDHEAIGSNGGCK